MQSIPPKNTLATRTFVHPLNQVTHQHGTASHIGVEAILTRHPSALFVKRDPSQSLREDFSQHPSTIRASLTAARPEPAQTSNFGPDHIRSINPFLFTSFDALSQPKTSASLSCSRKTCTAQSATRRRRSTPQHHHFHRRCCAVTIVSSGDFSLA